MLIGVTVSEGANCVSTLLTPVISAVAAILGTIVGAGVTYIREELRDKKQRKRDADYGAIRVSPLLDKLVRECLLVALDDGKYCGFPVSQGEMCAPTTKTPTFDPLSLDVTWKAFEPGLLNEVLSLQDEMQAIEEHVVEFSEQGSSHDHSDTLRERQLRYAEFGLKVSRLACRIRTRAGLVQLDYSKGEARPADELLKIKTRIEEALADESR